MHDFKKILVYQDAYHESVKALEFAATIGSELKVLDIQPPFPAFWHDLIDEEFEETPAVHRHKNLCELVLRVDCDPAEVTTEVKRGRPVVQVVETAVCEGQQLVIKEAHSKVRDYLFGSIDFRLIRYCPVPLLLIHPKSAVRPERILVAINPEAEGEEVDLNKRLIVTASSLANHFHCKLAVVSAYQTPRAMLGHSVDPDLSRRLDRHEKEYRRRCRTALEKILQSSLKPVKSENIFVDAGRPSDVILHAVEQFEPDLLVVGSVARQWLSGLLIGNTAERVLRSVNCSILTIKPKRFVSPIIDV